MRPAHAQRTGVGVGAAVVEHRAIHAMHERRRCGLSCGSGSRAGRWRERKNRHSCVRGWRAGRCEGGRVSRGSGVEGLSGWRACRCEGSRLNNGSGVEVLSGWRPCRREGSRRSRCCLSRTRQCCSKTGGKPEPWPLWRCHRRRPLLSQLPQQHLSQHPLLGELHEDVGQGSPQPERFSNANAHSEATGAAAAVSRAAAAVTTVDGHGTTRAGTGCWPDCCNSQITLAAARICVRPLMSRREKARQAAKTAL